MKPDSHTAENLRYLLWQRNIPKDQWAECLKEWIGCDRYRADALLTGTRRPSSEEQNKIARITEVSEEDLRLTRLLTAEEILRGNVQYLLNSLERGKQKTLARYTGASEVTVSRWHTGAQLPTKGEYLDGLRRYFGLPADIDLKDEPLFLSLSPIGDKQRREWLCAQIHQLRPETLRRLFPALERLLREP
jgi:transcriptional regulator with XRE-family HTH domain